MNANELRTAEAPLKARYRAGPGAALVKLTASGTVHAAAQVVQVETHLGPVARHSVELRGSSQELVEWRWPWFEIHIPIQHFGGKECPRQGSAKNGTDASPHARDHEGTTLACGKPEPASDVRAEPSADLGNWTFPAGRATGAHCDGGCDCFDEGDTCPDLAVVKMVRCDRGIGAVPLCLGRKRVDQNPADQATKCW